MPTIKPVTTTLKGYKSDAGALSGSDKNVKGGKTVDSPTGVGGSDPVADAKAPQQGGAPDAGNRVPTATTADQAKLGTDQVLAQQGVSRAGLQNGVGQLFTAAANAAPPASAPAEPNIQKLYDDPDFKALYAFTMEAAGAVQREHRQWDQLGMIKTFSAAAAFMTKGAALPSGVKASSAEPLKQRFPDAMAQRAMCHLLLLLMPEDTRTERAILGDGSRGAPQSLFNPFPDAVVARADDGFKLKKGDLPALNPHLTEPFRAVDLVDNVFQPGQRGTFLAPKKYSPGAFLQDRKDLQAGKEKADQAGHDGDPIFVQIRDVFVDDRGEKMARVSVPAQHKVRNGHDGGFHQNELVLGEVEHVLDKNGKPVLGPDGQPQPILVPVKDLADYLLDPGNVRGSGKLDLERSRDDRALALTFSHELKSRYLTDSNGYTKSVFDWLQEADLRTPRQDIERIKQGAWQAAFDSVVKYASHPRRTHFKITVDNDPHLSKDAWQAQNGWKQEAMEVLEKSGLNIQDSGQRYARDSSQIGERWENHQLSWTSNFLGRGFEGGTLDCYGLADAFDRLSATFLAPLGILSMADIAEGHGASVGRMLSHPDENGVIQAGIPRKVKPNELIAGFDLMKSSGVGPSAGVYWINFGGYVNIDPPSGKRYDLARDAEHAQSLVAGLGD